MDRSTAQVVAEMREKGLRVMPQREAILDCLLATGEHPSVRQIWEAARKSVPEISLSTVYGSVSELSRIGLVSNSTGFAQNAPGNKEIP